MVLFRQVGLVSATACAMIAMLGVLSHESPSVASSSHVGSRFALMAWPSSDARLDVAHGSRISLALDNYTGVAAGTVMVLHWSISNLLRVEETPFGYELVFFDRRWGAIQDYHVPLSERNRAFITGYNPSFLSYVDAIDGRQHVERFRQFFTSENTNIPLGSYLSATTCVDDPQSPDNLSGAGNHTPITVMDCCAISGDCHVAMNSALLLDADDGRWYLDFANADLMVEVVDHVQSVIEEQHADSPFLFLDNGRYVLAHWSDRATCQKAFMSCRSACDAADQGCLDACDDIECVDRRSTTPMYPVPGDDFAIWPYDLYAYYEALVAALNNGGRRAILNVSVLPALLGEHIESGYLTKFEQSIGENGLAFEQVFHRSIRLSPKYTRQEIDIYRRFLSGQKSVILYPDYHDMGAQHWTAAMAMNLREPGQSIFLTRSAYEPVPGWAYWPQLYGAPNADMEFATTCTDCMNKRGGYAGDWLFRRSYEHGSLTASHSNLVIAIEKPNGSDLLVTDIPLTSVSISDLLGQPMNGFSTLHPGDFGDLTFGPGGDANYTVVAAALVDEFAGSVGRVDFPASGVIEHQVQDVASMGEGCLSAWCQKLVASSLEITLRITEAP